jgi:hypothetical protein
LPPTERSGAAGRTPAPGGGRGSRGPAAASSVKVDTTDVAKLKQLLGDSAKNAELLAKNLTKFDSGPLAKLNTEVKSLRDALGRANVGRSSGGSKSTPGGGSGGSYLPTGQHSTNGGQGTGNGGSSYLTGHWSTLIPAGAGRAFGVAAVEAASGLSSLMAGHLQDAVGRSYLLNRWQMSTGGSTSYGAQVGLGRGLAGMFGNNTLGYTDATQAAGTLLATGAVSGGFGQSRVASAAFGASLNPTQGALGGAQMTSRLFTSQNYYHARLAGINMMAGGRQNLQSFMDQVINRYEAAAGHKLSPAEIQSGNQQGMPLYLTLVGMGFQDDGDRQNLLTYWLARNRTGKTGTAALQAAGANAGLFKQAQQTANARGQALSQVDIGGMRGMQAGLRGKQLEYEAGGDLAQLAPAVTTAVGALSAFSGELKLINKLMEAMIGGSILRRLLGGGAGGGGGGGLGLLGGLARTVGVGGGATTAVEGALGRIGLGGLASRVGAGGLLRLGAGRLLGAGALGLAGDVAGNLWSSAWGSSHHSTGQIGGDALKGAGIGAAVGSVVPVVGTGVGAAVGAGVGAVYGARHGIEHAASSAWHWAFGDSNRKTPPLTDTGVTWPNIEKIAQKGPPHIVTSTTTGTHAQNSYHYRGQAVDFAAPGGGSDTPGLLAINRYWASRYGKQLVELIYAGPGGVCIKDGKVVNGNAFYGAATMAEHHNHVHVAATPRSLGGAGGGVAVGAAPGNNSGTATVGAAPASSSGGFAAPAGGSLIGGLFSSSSGGSLLAALTSLAGGVGGYATSGGAPTGVGYAAGGGSSSTPGTASTGSVPAAPQAVKGAVALGKQMAAARGWGGSEWDALYRLWNNESGWNPGARNSSSGAAGIPQDITGNMHGGAGGQIKWGMDYIAHRYGDPLKALAFWNRTDPRPYPGHWYEGGKWELIRDEIAQLHKGEMVLPATTAEKLRKAVGGDGPQVAAASSSRGRRAVPVQLVFMVQRGTEAEMRAAARRFAKYVEDDHDIELVASR